MSLKKKATGGLVLAASIAASACSEPRYRTVLKEDNPNAIAMRVVSDCNNARYGRPIKTNSVRVELSDGAMYVRLYVDDRRRYHMLTSLSAVKQRVQEPARIEQLVYYGYQEKLWLGITSPLNHHIGIDHPADRDAFRNMESFAACVLNDLRFQDAICKYMKSNPN